ncbi:MAG: hypothetical protein BAJATHORv1_20307 [Candidatus Thorarchaeota archaeon]|nr:MAG: hypothetical protein BAJATHORv1_20307 [Candidatus Thorarchaeota archaeon]
MKIKDAQEIMRRIYLDRDRRRGMDRTLLRTFQEMGELSEAIQKGKDIKEIKEEIADVFAWVCSIANLIDVDITQAFFEKYPNACSRCHKTPCSCQNEP